MMKRNLFLALLLTIVMLPGMQAQTLHDNHSTSKIERRRLERQERELQDSLQFVQLSEALKNGSFVLEANSVRLESGRMFFVTSALNFIQMENLDRGTVQIGQNGPIVGPNGVGGITVDGNITHAEFSIDKRGNVKLTFDIWGIGISAKVYITLYKNSTRASAEVSPNFNRYNLFMEGNLCTLDESTVYKGRAL